MAANRNGVYSVSLSVNGKVYTEYDFESFSFGETRYINTLVDYDHLGKYRQRIQKCFKSPGNKLSIYNTLYNKGEISIQEGLSYNIELLIKDLEGNKAKLIIPVEGKQSDVKIKKQQKKTPYYVVANKPNNFDLNAAKVYFPTNTFYEDFYLDLEKGEDTVKIHTNTVPAHRNFTITFDVSKYSKEEQKQLFIARLGRNLKPS